MMKIFITDVLPLWTRPLRSRPRLLRQSGLLFVSLGGLEATNTFPNEPRI